MGGDAIQRAGAVVEFQAVHHDQGIAIEADQRRVAGGQIERIKRVVTGRGEVNDVVHRIVAEARGRSRVRAHRCDQGLGPGRHVDRVEGARGINGVQLLRAGAGRQDRGSQDNQSQKGGRSQSRKLTRIVLPLAVTERLTQLHRTLSHRARTMLVCRDRGHGIDW